MSSFLKYQYNNLINNYIINNNYRYLNNNVRQSFYNRNPTNNIHNQNQNNQSQVRKNYNIAKKRIIIDHDLVSNIQYNYLLKLNPLNMSNRLELLRQLKHIEYFENEHNYSKSVELLENYIVKKTLKYNTLGYYLFKNEVNALIKLSQYSHFPKIIAYDLKNLIIYMSYCGEQITNNNIPVNWREQFKEIKHILEISGVNSNDMLLRNTCVLKDIIYIIDFGLHSIFNENIRTVLGGFYTKLNQLAIKN